MLQTPEEWRKHLDKLEALECEDWIEDCKRREWLQSDEYKARKELAEKFKKRK